MCKICISVRNSKGYMSAHQLKYAILYITIIQLDFYLNKSTIALLINVPTTVIKNSWKDMAHSFSYTIDLDYFILKTKSIVVW
jgi:hypothetical protein